MHDGLFQHRGGQPPAGEVLLATVLDEAPGDVVAEPLPVFLFGVARRQPVPGLVEELACQWGTGCTALRRAFPRFGSPCLQLRLDRVPELRSNDRWMLALVDTPLVGVVAPLWLRANAPMVVAEVCSTMKYPKRSQYKHAKQKKYHVRNWAEYNEGLRRRGDLTVWFDEEAIANWMADKTGKPGGQRVYSDLAIETSLVVRMVYKLAYRQTEGFLNSIASLLGLGIEIPDYSTLSRRSRLLRKKLRIPKAASNQPIHLMIDSTGLRIHVGSARKPPKQRAWRKLHIAVDRKTGTIVASELTASRARDATRVPALLTQIQAPLVSVAADSAYDKEAVYEAIAAHSPGRRTRVVIPPQRNAALSRNSNTAMQERDRHIRAIERHGRREWYKLSGCTKRSMVENAVYRYKAIIGPEMRTRTLARQRVEHRIGCEILNKMTALGMPDTYCAG